jgi:tetratricopeptide (TPR) repeat protein
VVGPLGDAFYRLALCHQALGHKRPALAAARESVRLCEGLDAKRPSDPACSRALLTSLALLAQVQEGLGERDAAAATARQITERIDRLAEAAKDDPPRRARAAWHLAQLSPYLRQGGRPEEALRAADRSRQMFEELVRERPNELAFQVGLSMAWQQTAKALWRFKDHDRVLKACQESLAVQQRVFEAAPRVYEYRALLDDRHLRLERILGELGRLDELLSSVHAREKLWPEDGARLRAIADDLRKEAGEVAKGRAELSAEERERRERLLKESARLRQKADGLRPLPPDGAGGLANVPGL